MPRNYKFYPKTACHFEMHKLKQEARGDFDIPDCTGQWKKLLHAALGAGVHRFTEWQAI